jgi:hypothetical protein
MTATVLVRPQEADMPEATVMGTRINVDESFVTISRRLPRSEKQIPLGTISSVDFLAPSITAPGHLQVVVDSAAEDQAAAAETTVEFQLRQRAEFETVRNAIEARISSRPITD